MRNLFSDLPSGEQMNQCIPLAHYLACFAKQRTSGLRQQNQRSVGFCPFPMLLPPSGPAHKLGKRRRWWASGVASLRWFRQQRPPHQSFFSCFELLFPRHAPRYALISGQTTSETRAFTVYLQTDEILWQMVICPIRRFVLDNSSLGQH